MKTKLTKHQIAIKYLVELFWLNEALVGSRLKDREIAWAMQISIGYKTKYDKSRIESLSH